MKILKVINNNVVSACDDQDKEIVVMGKGVGFGKKSGDMLERQKIEKIFSLPDESTGRLEMLLGEIPYEHMQTANKIIAMAKDRLDRRLNKNIYITLTDHLNFAITRVHEGIMVENALLWEIKRFYQKEFDIGMEALNLIEKNLGVTLSEDEAGFFALHIVNAEMDADMSQTINVPGIIKDVVNILSYTFGVEIDPKHMFYERFIIHLKFFLERAVKGEAYGDDNTELHDMVKDAYPKSYRCAIRIRDYIRARMKYEVSLEEIAYLTIHIQRVVVNKKS